MIPPFECRHQFVGPCGRTNAYSALEVVAFDKLRSKLELPVSLERVVEEALGLGRPVFDLSQRLLEVLLQCTRRISSCHAFRQLICHTCKPGILRRALLCRRGEVSQRCEVRNLCRGALD